MRNDPKNPTKGSVFQAGADFAGLGGDVQYVQRRGRGARLLSDHREDHLRRPRHRRPHRGLGRRGRPPLDLFFKGGETVRGFDRAGYGPRDLNTGDALGGTTYWATTAEVRFPIPFVPDDLGISGAVFADAGSLFDAGGGA